MRENKQFDGSVEALEAIRSAIEVHYAGENELVPELVLELDGLINRAKAGSDITQEEIDAVNLKASHIVKPN